MDRIIELVAYHFGVGVDDITGESRKRMYVIPRHMAMMLIYELVTPCYTAIALYMSLDHQSVIHAVKSSRDHFDIKSHRDYLRQKVAKELDLDLTEKITELNEEPI